MLEFFTVLVLTYTVGGYEVQSRVLFPSAELCGDALSAYYGPIYAFDKNSMAQCERTDELSKTIRPKPRPQNGE
jgi:hypothetical protein